MKALNNSVCVDDFGNEVYLCNWTNEYVYIPEYILLAPILPSVKGSYVSSKDAGIARKASMKAFEEFDSNCNTCKQFSRNPAKIYGGFVEGSCLKQIKSRVFRVHPSDPMFMNCWEKR